MVSSSALACPTPTASRIGCSAPMCHLFGPIVRSPPNILSHAQCMLCKHSLIDSGVWSSGSAYIHSVMQGGLERQGYVPRQHQ